MVSITTAEQIDIYILSGQSNMDGRAFVNEIGAGDPLGLPQQGARIWYQNPAEPGTNQTTFSSNGWQILEPGYSIPFGFSGTLLTGRFGPEVSFASAIRDATGTQNQIGLIKVSKGGTSIQESIGEWHGDPNDNPGYLFSALVEQVGLALAALEADGDIGVIKGMIWHQGESDRNFSSYIAEFEELIEGVRSELGIPDLPFVAGELSQQMADNAAFNASLATFINAPSSVNLGLVLTDGLTTDNGNPNDLTHFDTVSQFELGQRYGAMLATLVDTPDTVLPTAFNVFRGVLLSGGLAEIADSDDTYMQLNPGFTLDSMESPVWLLFDAALANDSPAGLLFSIESSANTIGLERVIELYNFDTSSFEVLSQEMVSFNEESVSTVCPSGDLSRFVESGTGAVEARVGWNRVGFTLIFPWRVDVDQISWSASN